MIQVVLEAGSWKRPFATDFDRVLESVGKELGKVTLVSQLERDLEPDVRRLISSFRFEQASEVAAG